VSKDHPTKRTKKKKPPSPTVALTKLEEAHRALFAFQGTALDQDSDYELARESFDEAIYDYVEVTKDCSHPLVHNRIMMAKLAEDRKFFKDLGSAVQRGVGRHKKLTKEEDLEFEVHLAGIILDFVEVYETKRNITGFEMLHSKLEKQIEAFRMGQPELHRLPDDISLFDLEEDARKVVEDIEKLKAEWPEKSKWTEEEVVRLPTKPTEVWRLIFERVSIDLLPEKILSPPELKKWAKIRPTLRELIEQLDELVRE
jgi:hypothetical protein